jgi:signal peptidase II
MTVRAVALLAATVLLLDRLTKMLLLEYLPRGGYVEVIPGFFSLVHVRNTGAAFGLLAHDGWTWRSVLLSVVAAAAVLGMGWLVSKVPVERRAYRASLAAIMGGALGNLWDRIAHGAVLDFADFYLGAWHWPAFNVADSAISVGVVVLLWCTWREPAA